MDANCRNCHPLTEALVKDREILILKNKRFVRQKTCFFHCLQCRKLIHCSMWLKKFYLKHNISGSWYPEPHNDPQVSIKRLEYKEAKLKMGSKCPPYSFFEDAIKIIDVFPAVQKDSTPKLEFTSVQRKRKPSLNKKNISRISRKKSNFEEQVSESEVKFLGVRYSQKFTEKYLGVKTLQEFDDSSIKQGLRALNGCKDVYICRKFDKIVKVVFKLDKACQTVLHPNEEDNTENCISDSLCSSTAESNMLEETIALKSPKGSSPSISKVANKNTGTTSPLSRCSSSIGPDFGQALNIDEEIKQLNSFVHLQNDYVFEKPEETSSAIEKASVGSRSFEGSQQNNLDDIDQSPKHSASASYKTFYNNGSDLPQEACPNFIENTPSSEKISVCNDHISNSKPNPILYEIVRAENYRSSNDSLEVKCPPPSSLQPPTSMAVMFPLKKNNGDVTVRRSSVNISLFRSQLSGLKRLGTMIEKRENRQE